MTGYHDHGMRNQLKKARRRSGHDITKLFEIPMVLNLESFKIMTCFSSPETISFQAKTYKLPTTVFYIRIRKYLDKSKQQD